MIWRDMVESAQGQVANPPISGVILGSDRGLAPRELRGLRWMATSALLYAIAALIASAAYLLLTALRPAGSAILFPAGAGLSFVLFSGLLLSWILGIPALVTLGLGLHALAPSGTQPGHAIRLEWLLLGAGIGLFAVVFALLGVRIAATVAGLASAFLLLYAAALPGLRRTRRLWGSPMLLALLLGVAAIVIEAAADFAPPSLNGAWWHSSQWSPLGWGIPSTFVVLASALALWWGYASLQRTASVRPRSSESPLRP